MYTNRLGALIEALKEEVTFPWVEPIPESEVDINKIIVDATELENKDFVDT